jgi:hypothetical protein
MQGDYFLRVIDYLGIYLKLNFSVPLILMFPYYAMSQANTEITFQSSWEDVTMHLDSQYRNNNSEWIQFSALKWYCSDLQVTFSNHVRWQHTKRHLLLDFSEPETTKIIIPHALDLSVIEISFTIGIDSLTQSAGAIGDDLDPTNGMYWTWQSGYIHTKIEGNTSLSNHPKREFAMHLGGYRHPLNTVRQVTFPVRSHLGNIVITADLTSFIRGCNLNTNHHIMSPSKTASDLATLFASSLNLKEP